MNYVLLILYFAISFWGITSLSFIKNSGLSVTTIGVLFVIKIITGLALGWVSLHFYGSKPVDNDYWKMNIEGWQEYQLLVHHPKQYLCNLFVSPYGHDSGFFSSVQSYWNDLKNNLILKLVSLFNIYSRGDYYINSLFINCIGFLGHVALYRVFIQIYKEKKVAVIIGCFLLPSCLYFSSGLHKDAVVFSALAFFCFTLYRCITQKMVTTRSVFTLMMCSMTLLLIRSYVLVLLVPATLSYFLSIRRLWSPLLIFATVYILFITLFFSVSKLAPSINPPATVIQKQQDFLAAERLSTSGPAKTAIPTLPLEPDFASFAKNAPPALARTLMRPYLAEHQSKFLVPLSIELFLYQVLFIISLVVVIMQLPVKINPFVLFGIFLSLTIYLSIGYIVDNIGSIVRYRALYLPLLLTPCLAVFKWKSIKIK